MDDGAEMFEIVNMENGLVLAEVDDRYTALMMAARWADKNDFTVVTVIDEWRMVTVDRQVK
jgi:hypothetical protein